MSDRVRWPAPSKVARALAVDIGGTKIAAGIVTSNGTIERRASVPTPKTYDAESVFGALLELVRESPIGDAVVCGVGCGGPMTLDLGEVSPVHIPAWRAFPLRARLADATGLPVFVDNDAKALAVGEGWLGAAAGVDDYIAVVVSTGVGGGIVLNGLLLDGASGNAGHIGHVIVDPHGRACHCGGRGCLTVEASGTAIERINGRPPAEAGVEVMEHTGRLVGRALASVVHLLDLRLAVVGGSVALGFGDPFFKAAQDELDALARLEFAQGARVVPAALGDRGPLVGAAAVGFRGLSLRGAR